MPATRDDVHLRASAEADLVVSGWLDRFLGGGDIGTRETAAVLGELGGALWRRGARGDGPRTRRGPPAETDAIADALYAEVRRDAAAANWPDPEASGQIAVRRLALACERAVVDLHKAGNRWWEQPRVPRGDPDGGQWTEAGGGGGGASAMVYPRPPQLTEGDGSSDLEVMTGGDGDDVLVGGRRDDDFDARRRARIATQGDHVWFNRVVRRALVHFAVGEVIDMIADYVDPSPEGRALRDARPVYHLDELRSGHRTNEVYRSDSHWEGEHGNAGPGYEWHHLIPRMFIGQGGISEADVYVWENTVHIPKLLHERISAEYYKPKYFTNGLPLKDWLSGKPKGMHIRIAKELLRDNLLLK